MLLKPSPKTEEKYRQAATTELYQAQFSLRASHPRWTTHDGPPYANGPVHMGHLLNKVNKDIFNRYRLLRGHQLHYVPGWDCHGLPIELKSQEGKSREELAATPASQLRRWARRVAEKAIVGQQASFERWGVAADWRSPQGTYRTMDPAYEAAQLRIFWRMYQQGLIYRGVKPIYWSPSTRTALAEAELEYRDRTSPAVFVRFPILSGNDLSAADGIVSSTQISENRTHGSLQELFGSSSVDALIWTTTPWTLQANRAICIHPSFSYAVVQPDAEGARAVLVAEDRIDALRAEGVLTPAAQLLRTGIPGSALLHLRCQHPLLSGLQVPLLGGHHVTAESGTGLVHTAPGHGHDDWAVCQKHGIEVYDSVDEEGRFRQDAGEFAGLDVFSERNEGSQAVIGRLREEGALFFGPYAYAHRYPYDWRTGQPVIIRTTAQWFAKLDDGVRALALQAISETADGKSLVEMIPSASRPRLRAMLVNRYDWCISRQRLWGVPIPVFYHPVSRAPLIDAASVRHFAGLVEQHGTDCWFWMDQDKLVPPEWTEGDFLQGVAPQELIKGMDTMDVWFDSGTSWGHVLGTEGAVADLVLEGSDQHRGWFQSLLLTHVGYTQKALAPYKTVLTHGFVLDDKGRKMSKSLGNVLDPEKVATEISVEATRLWVASNKLANADVLASKESLDKSLQLLKRIRNTLKFTLGSIASPDEGFSGALPPLQLDRLSSLDRYFLHHLYLLSQSATHAYDEFNPGQVVQLISHFIPNVASPIYFEAVKDRLYCDAVDSDRRQNCLSVLSHFLIVMLRILAPILPFTLEEIHAEHYPLNDRQQPALLSLGWFDASIESWNQPELAAQWESILTLRTHINHILERQAPETRSIQTAITLSDHNSPAPLSFQALQQVGASELSDIFAISNISFNSNIHDAAPLLYQGTCRSLEIAPLESFQIAIHDVSSSFHKCPRCWRFTPDSVCQRCQSVLQL